MGMSPEFRAGPPDPDAEEPAAEDKEWEPTAAEIEEFWKRFEGLAIVDQDERFKLFDELREIFPGTVKDVVYQAGYRFMKVRPVEVFGTLTRGQNAADKVQCGADRGVIWLRREIEANRQEVRTAFKIHLQPVHDKAGVVVRRFIEIFRQPENGALRQAVPLFKVRESPPKEDDPRDLRMPEVVIYVDPGDKPGQEGAEEARRRTEAAIGTIVAGMADLEELANRDPRTAPRYNEKITDLVYVAQSGGDFKEFLESYGLLDEFFDKERNYAYLKGEEPLARPEAAEMTIKKPKNA